MEEWEEHFRKVLGGVGWRVRRGEITGRRKDAERDIEIEEIRRVIKGLKDGKAAGGDGIPNEVWKYGGCEIEEWLMGVCNKVWRGEGWPEDWSEGVVIPVAKKGDSSVVENYRGITLTQTAYKIYAAVLAERLRQEVEGKINRQVKRKVRKLVILFVDLKAAFDTVNRDVLIRAMKIRGVREGLVERCEEVLMETKTDLDEELEKGCWGGVKLGDRKVFTLAYADDVAMLAESEDDMRGMIGVLERYLEGKRLELNTEKSKMMRCRRGGGRWKKMSWRWKGKVLEEVKEYRYLGYTITRDGGQRAHVEERLRKGAAAMGQIWAIGKRRFAKDWGRRLWLFDRLIWAVISYGVEIWGWKERAGLERLQERYLRWLLGVGKGHSRIR
ncbi:uncharacterized protein LOC143217535 [Lasioglossum baleicum]|uniref:uncharacterized protein LOC143217535 n=1 Tax=Lasioglossum baleicum TaxID=434251 RepID=UPI003FCCFFDA